MKTQSLLAVLEGKVTLPAAMEIMGIKAGMPVSLNSYFALSLVCKHRAYKTLCKRQVINSDELYRLQPNEGEDKDDYLAFKGEGIFVFRKGEWEHF